jgi:hypothetical protein
VDVFSCFRDFGDSGILTDAVEESHRKKCYSFLTFCCGYVSIGKYSYLSPDINPSLTM